MQPQRDAPSTLIALAVSCSLFMDLTDTAALATALPTLSHEFGVSPVELKFALTAYLIVAGVLIPIGGWLADRHGARRVFLIALSTFLAGSACCALAQNLEQLVLARLLQGVGGGMMTPVGRLIVVATAPRSELVRALNWFTIPAIIGPLIGPPLAGLLIEVASWRWIFLINIPVGIAGFLLVRQVVPPLVSERLRRLDVRGALLAILAIGSFMILVDVVGMSSVGLGPVTLLAVLAVVSNVVMVRHMLRTENAILDLRLFGLQTFRASIIGGAAIRIGLGALPFLLPLLLQSALGWSPLQSGFVMLVAALGSLAARLVGPAALKKFGFRNTLLFFAFFGSLSSALPAVFRPWTPPLLIFALAAIANVMRVTHFIACSALTFSDVAAEENSRASTLSAMMQQLTLSLGVSFGAMLLAFAHGGGAAPLSFHDFVAPFLVIGAVGLLAMPEYVRLPPDAGESMRSGSPRSRGVGVPVQQPAR